MVVVDNSNWVRAHCPDEWNGVQYREAQAFGVGQRFIVSTEGKIFKYLHWRCTPDGKGRFIPRKACKPSGNQKYWTVNIRNGTYDKTKTTVHRVVAETFLGEVSEDKNWIKLRPECFTEEEWMSFTDKQRDFMSHGIHIDHINGDREDNRVENLQYMWAKDNIVKGGVARR